MKTGYTISALGHAAVLLWSVFSLSAKPLPAVLEPMPVDLVTASEFSKITAGVKDAPKAETPKPLVEQVADAKPVEDMAAKVDNKEIKSAREAQPSPPEPKPIDPKPDAKPTEAKPAETKEQKQADSKPDPIADALAKDEAKKQEQKKAEAKTPMPPRKPAPPAPKFDPRQVEALLDKRDATRFAAAGDKLNVAPSVGMPKANAEAMSMSELDALRARLASLWNIPAGAKDPRELTVLVRIKLKPDGTLNGPPMVLTSGSSPLFAAARDSAIRALFRGQPYDMLRPEHYDLWKDIEITFDPQMIRG
jgi:outer membrane biosynthesis protein TonB